MNNPGGMVGLLNNLRTREADLLRNYERALSALGVPADSLRGAD